MKKKICPVCDRELTAAGYCKLCRRLVLRPLVREIDYYLNETPPDEGAILNRKAPDGGRPEPSGKTDWNGKLARLYEEARRQAEELAGEGRRIQTGNKRAAGTGSTGRGAAAGSPVRAAGTENPGRGAGTESRGNAAGREDGSGRKKGAASGNAQGLNRMFGRPGQGAGWNAAPSKPRREISERARGAAVAGAIVLCIVLMNALPLISNLFYGKVQDTFVELEPDPGWEDGAFFSGDSEDGPDGWEAGMEYGEDSFETVEAAAKDTENASENMEGEPGYEEFISTHGVIVPEDQTEGTGGEQGITTETLDEAQVRAAGVRCPDMEHFRCTGETLDQGVAAVLEQKGLTYGRTESTNNYRIESGGGSYEFYNYYRDYTVWGENGDPAVLVSVGSDTATDEVHSVSVNAYSPDDSGLAAELMARIADLAAESEGTVTPQELLSAVAEESYVDRGEYNYFIYGYDYEGVGLVMAPCGNWDENWGIY